MGSERRFSVGANAQVPGTEGIAGGERLATQDAPEPGDPITCEACEEEVPADWIGATESGDPWCFRCIAEDLQDQLRAREDAPERVEGER